ncbi:MAG: hypothetical protein M3N98_01000 [Actinomycetota bacterium]|nr:hypothetical protein [Actinomycetota bacterium]
MGAVTAFVLGYLLGGQTQRSDKGEVADSLETIRGSGEFEAFVMMARSQIGRTLRQVADLVDDVEPSALEPPDLVDQVRQLVKRP